MRLVFPLLVAAALAVPSAAADHCTTWSTSTTDEDTLVIEVPVALGFPQYLVFDICQPECLFSVWVYPEANGIPGLQRGDEVHDDTCHGMIEADVLIGL